MPAKGKVNDTEDEGVDNIVGSMKIEDWGNGNPIVNSGGNFYYKPYLKLGVLDRANAPVNSRGNPFKIERFYLIHPCNENFKTVIGAADPNDFVTSCIKVVVHPGFQGKRDIAPDNGIKDECSCDEHGTLPPPGKEQHTQS